MAKQTFTAGQVLTATQMNNLQANDYNWTTSAQTASYVLVAANAGQTVTMTNASATTITVNTGLFAAGDTVRIINLGAGRCTITAGTATVNSSGSLVLPQYASGTLWFSSASAAIFIPDEKITQQIAIFNETQTGATNGGTSTAGAFDKRTLNTTVTNTIGGCSLASSVVTLATPGTYYVRGYTQAWQAGVAQCRLRNTTAGTTIANGQQGYAGGGFNVQAITTVETLFTITTSTNIEFQMRVGAGVATFGLGNCSNFDESVYSILYIERTA